MPADDFIVTPWHVEGEIDYDKLIKQFGTEKITSEILKKIEKVTGEVHFMLRRGIFFSHRDLGRLLDDYSKGKKFFLYTGRGPSGHTHIGHLVPWVFAKWLQEKFDTTMYFQLTDDEKFYAKQGMTMKETNLFAHENALDFIALGFSSQPRQR
jgi:tryptophanyl-tRNA synthetase